MSTVSDQQIFEEVRALLGDRHGLVFTDSVLAPFLAVARRLEVEPASACAALAANARGLRKTALNLAKAAGMDWNDAEMEQSAA